ncbi:MAG: hypothetical protein HYZ16_05205 [Bacteroidetes bacterium]|nr:hypothetical protein [Bacteroidota bacterium]
MKLKHLLILAVTSSLFLFQSCDKEDPKPDPDDDPKTTVKGCMDPKSFNFNPAATEDDGTCQYASATEAKFMFVDFTGTWCWACGDYGAKMVQEMKAAFPNNMVVMEVHKGSSDPMTSTTGVEWLNYWPHSSTPSFVCKDSLVSGHPISPSQSIANSFLSIPAVVGFHHEFTQTEGRLAGKAYLQAQAPLMGKINLGVYVRGHGMIHEQQGDDGSAFPDLEFNTVSKKYPNYVHDYILQAEATNQAFGTQGFADGAAEGEYFTVEYAIDFSTKWAPEWDIVLIAWQKHQGRYTFLNAAVYEK